MRRATLTIVSVLALAGCAGAQRPADVAPAAAAPVADRAAPRAADADDLARALAAVPRRAPADPIEVVVFDPAVPTLLRRDLGPAKMEQALVAALASDRGLRVRLAGELADSLGRKPATLAEAVAIAEPREARRPDVWLFPRVVQGGEPKAFRLELDLASAWDGAPADAGASGTVAESARVVSDAAARARAAIAARLAAGLPSRPAALGVLADRARADAARQADEVARRRAAEADLAARAGIDPDDDAMTRLRKLQEAQQRAGSGGQK